MIIKAKSSDPKVMGICDPHMSAFNPASYKVEYWTLVLSVIKQIQDYAIKNEVDVIAWAGDLFHLKAPSRNPHWFVNEVIRLMRRTEEAGIINAGIGGNHDMKFGSKEEGLKGQPLDTLIASGVYHMLDDEDVVIQGDYTQVRIAGASFFHGKAHDARDKKKEPGDTTLLTVGHFWFGPATGDFFGEPVFGPEFFKGSDSDVYLIGHHHEDQGVVEKDGKLFISVGSLSKTGLHKHDRERRPAAPLITFSEQGIDVKVLRPKFPPIEEIMDLEVREKVLKERQELEEFTNSLKETELKGGDPFKVLAELSVPAEVKARALQYLEDAAT